MKVKLSDIIDAIEMANQYSESFLDRKTGEIVWISEMAMTSDEQEEAYEQLDEHGFYRLPSTFDIREYDMMEEFIYSLPEPLQNKLEQVIRGKGAFRRFKNTIRYLGIEDEWYQYQASEYRRKKLLSRITLDELMARSISPRSIHFLIFKSPDCRTTTFISGYFL